MPHRVPAARLERWVANFGDRHGDVALRVESGRLCGVAADGSTFEAAPPFDGVYEGEADVGAFIAGCAVPPRWGVLLVRKGGFAVARFEGERMVEHKIGQRHVQGRTKAGGQSQQRFARRRDNQARNAYQAAAEHAARVLGPSVLPALPLLPVVTGGDRAAVHEVLADSRLARLHVTSDWLPVADPRRAVLDAAAADARSARVEVVNAPGT